MTPEDKISKLVRYIEKEFPRGCEGAKCDSCELHGRCEETIDGIVCDMLSHIEGLDVEWLDHYFNRGEVEEQ